MEKGYVQIYTGDGKGKTTAALGLGFRAVGRGLNVLMVQFLKGMYTGELDSINKFDNFSIKRLGVVDKFTWSLSESETKDLINKTQGEWQDFLAYLKNNPCDVLILDEVMGALKVGMLTTEQLCEFIDKKPDQMELVLTGRAVPKEVEEKADLITEMRKIRHYHDKGVLSRDGIER